MKKLLVGMMLWSITLNAAEGPSGESATARAAAAEKALVDAQAHQREMQAELEKKREEERTAQQRLDAARIAAKEPSAPAKAQAEVAAAQAEMDQITGQIASQETVFAQAVEEVSVAQTAAIEAQAQADQPALPGSDPAVDQPVTVEDLTNQLAANKRAQDDLQARISNETIETGKKNLEDKLLEVKTHGEALANAKDFLQFIAQNGLAAQFTEPELMKIFFQLGLPVVSADGIAEMDSQALLSLKKTQLPNVQSIVDSAEPNGTVLIKVGTIITDEPVSAEDGYVIKKDVKYKEEEDYFDSPFTQEKKEALAQYLEAVSSRVSDAYSLLNRGDDGKPNDDTPPAIMGKKEAEERLLTLNQMAEKIDALCSGPSVDKEAVLSEITSLLTIIKVTRKPLAMQGVVGGDAQPARHALEVQCKALYSRFFPLIDMTTDLRNNASLSTYLLKTTMEYLFYVDSNPGLEKMTQSAALTLLLEGNTSEFTEAQMTFIDTVRDQAVKFSALTEPGSTSDELQQQLSNLENFYTKTVQKTEWEDADSSQVYKLFADGVKQKLDFLSFQVNVPKIQEDPTFKITTVTDMQTVMDTLFYKDPNDLELQSKTRSNALAVLLKGAPDTFTPEQKQFVSTVTDQAKRLFDLKTKAADALKNNDVIAMQDLQDEMRDLYEDIYMNKWSDKDLADTQGAFLANVQSTLNDIISQFGQAAKTLPAITQGKKGLLSQLAYSFKRFVTGKWGYSSEAADAKARGQGLQLYDFKKSAITDYVNEAQQIKASGDQAAQVALDKEVAALKSIARCNGVITGSQVNGWFKSLPKNPTFLKSGKLLSADQLSADQVITMKSWAQLNGATVDQLALFDTPETRQYVIDAYNTGKDISVDSAGAQQIVAALSAQVPAVVK